jgi:hypothetical protein
MWVGGQRKDVRKYVFAVNCYILYKWGKKESLWFYGIKSIYRGKEQVGSVYVEFHESTNAFLLSLFGADCSPHRTGSTATPQPLHIQPPRAIFLFLSVLSILINFYSTF